MESQTPIVNKKAKVVSRFTIRQLENLNKETKLPQMLNFLQLLELSTRRSFYTVISATCDGLSGEEKNAFLKDLSPDNILSIFTAIANGCVEDIDYLIKENQSKVIQ